MTNVSFLLGLLASLAFPLASTGCTSADDNYAPDMFELHAATAELSWYSKGRTRFGVGLRAQIHARGTDGYAHLLTGVSCTEGCVVESLPSTDHPLFPSFHVTPLARTFKIHASVSGRHGRDSADVAFDRVLTADETSLVVTSDGALPGVPFLTGMTVAWQLAPSNESVAWQPALTDVALSGPFEEVDRLVKDEGVVVWFRARGPGRGVLVQRNGSVVAEHELFALDPSEIKTLHAVVTPPRAATLSSSLTERIALRARTTAKVWVAFETKTGELGIGGAGESFPAPGASFTFAEPYRYEPQTEKSLDDLRSQPYLDLEAKYAGTSQLLLRVADVTRTVDVVVQ